MVGAAGHALRVPAAGGVPPAAPATGPAGAGTRPATLVGDATRAAISGGGACTSFASSGPARAGVAAMVDGVMLWGAAIGDGMNGAGVTGTRSAGVATYGT